MLLRAPNRYTKATSTTRIRYNDPRTKSAILLAGRSRFINERQNNSLTHASWLRSRSALLLLQPANFRLGQPNPLAAGLTVTHSLATVSCCSAFSDRRLRKKGNKLVLARNNAACLRKSEIDDRRSTGHYIQFYWKNQFGFDGNSEPRDWPSFARKTMCFSLIQSVQCLYIFGIRNVRA